jgi:hypothetical protein
MAEPLRIPEPEPEGQKKPRNKKKQGLDDVLAAGGKPRVLPEDEGLAFAERQLEQAKQANEGEGQEAPPVSRLTVPEGRTEIENAKRLVKRFG